MAQEIDTKTFQDNVQKEGYAVIDFFAPWCGPCKMMGPAFSEVAEEKKDKAYFAKVNVDDNQSLAGEFGIRSIPTIIVFKDGKVAHQAVGMLSKEQIAAMVDEHVQ